MKKPTNKLSAADRERVRKFNEATGWIKHLDNASNSKGAKKSSSDNVYASALNFLGLIFVKRLTNAAKAGDSEAIRDMVGYCCEMAEAIEDVAEKQAGSLRELAARRPDWPVMLLGGWLDLSI
jgi:hypothetical protein